MTQRERLYQIRQQKDPTRETLRLMTERAARRPPTQVETITGEKGEPGYTPIKGKDYFTDAEIGTIVSFLLTQVKDGAPGEKGDTGQAGKNGRTPVRLVDYWTAADQEQIIRDVLKKVPVPKDGTSPKVEDVVTEVLKELKKHPNVDGLRLSALEKRLIRLGGGGASFFTQLQDSNISSPTNGQILVYNSTTGKWTNQANSATGTWFRETPTGTINGINTVFTLTRTPAANSEQLVYQGQRQHPTDDYTLSGTTITYVVAPFTGTKHFIQYQ